MTADLLHTLRAERALIGTDKDDQWSLNIARSPVTPSRQTLLCLKDGPRTLRFMTDQEKSDGALEMI